MPNRTLILLASAATLLAGCKSTPTPAPAPQLTGTGAGRIYTTNEVSGDMSVIDAGNFVTLATIPLGKRPRGLHPSPDHKFLYVALSGTPIAGPVVDESTLPPPDHSADGIGVFDVQANKITRTISAGTDPENFDVSADGKTIYVSNEDESAVSSIDIAAGKGGRTPTPWRRPSPKASKSPPTASRSTSHPR